MFSIYQSTLEWAQRTDLKFWATPHCTSTQILAKQFIEQKKWPANDSSFWVFADQQSAGRGRGQNLWSNPPSGSGFLSTWALKYRELPPIVTPLRLGYHIYRIMNQVWPTGHFSLKPPNDIFLKTQKVAGLLIEISEVENQIYVVIGLGINVWQHPRQHPEAGSLASLTLTETTWCEFLDQLTKLMTNWSEHPNAHTAHLTDEECQNLARAVARAPQFLEHNGAIRISPNGDLWIGDRPTPWRNL